MLIACSGCKAKYNIVAYQPRARCCACGITFDVPPEPTEDEVMAAIRRILAEEDAENDVLVSATVTTDEEETVFPDQDSEPETPPPPPDNGVADIIYHELPPPILDPYRHDRSWTYVVLVVDTVVKTLLEFEGRINQHALGSYDCETDQFRDADMDNIMTRVRDAKSAFGNQLANLPVDRQTVLEPYLAWSIEVSRYCDDMLEKRLNVAREENAWERQEYLDRLQAEEAEREWKKERNRRALAELSSSIDDLERQWNPPANLSLLQRLRNRL